MTIHECLPDHPGVLAADCGRCAEHAEMPMLLHLDQSKMEAMWDKMLAVERGPAHYAGTTEAKAGRQLYLLAIWAERYLDVDPWRPFAELRKRNGMFRR